MRMPIAKLILSVCMLVAALLVTRGVAKADGPDCVAWCQQCTVCLTGYCQGVFCQCDISLNGGTCPSSNLCSDVAN